MTKKGADLCSNRGEFPNRISDHVVHRRGIPGDGQNLTVSVKANVDSTHFMDSEAMCMCNVLYMYLYLYTYHINILYTVYYRDMLGDQSDKLMNEDRIQMRTQQDMSELS